MEYISGLAYRYEDSIIGRRMPVREYVPMPYVHVYADNTVKAEYVTVVNGNTVSVECVHRDMHIIQGRKQGYVLEGTYYRVADAIVYLTSVFGNVIDARTYMGTLPYCQTY